MQTLTENPTETTDAQAWDKFFDGEAKDKKTAPAPHLNQKNSYCASWINDQSFEINRADEPNESEIRLEFVSSPLSESVKCHSELNEKLKRNSRKSQSAKSEKPEEPPEKRPKPAPAPTPLTSFIKNINFFESVARANQEIRRSTNGSSKWRIINGIYLETDSETTLSSGPKTPYEELMSLFRKSVKINDGLTFEHSYPFDWSHFSRYGMQHVIFTKVCQSHPPGYFIEMRKEDTKCNECGGSDLAMTIRLTIPLSLAEIPIPADLNLGIHVAFVASKLPNFENLTLETGIFDYSRETAERMYKLYRKMLLGKTSDEYTKWFERCRRFVKNSLFSKRLRLFHGRVIRRKLEEVEHFTKRRCFIFADIFDFE